MEYVVRSAEGIKDMQCDTRVLLYGWDVNGVGAYVTCVTVCEKIDRDGDTHTHRYGCSYTQG